MKFSPDKIIIIGSGGTGGHLIPAVARLVTYHSSFENNVPNVLIVDGDKFEEKNQTRQIVSNSQLGKNKAQSMVEFCNYQGLDNVEFYDDYVDEQKMKRLLSSCTSPLVIACVDNDATRRVIIDSIDSMFSDNNDFFFVSPGNSDGTENVKGQAYWFGEIGGERFGINPKLLYDNIDNPTDYIPKKGSCSEHAPSRPQLISANFMAAAVTLSIVQNLLDGLLKPECNSYFFNLRTMQTSLN